MKGKLLTALASLVAFLVYASLVYLIHRRLGVWIGAAEALAVIATVLVALVVGKIYLKHTTRVLGERLDPDFGELTIYRNSWLSVLDHEDFEEPLLLSGEGTLEPTPTQRRMLLEMIDRSSHWINQITGALEQAGAVDPSGKPLEVVVLQIELKPHERAASVEVVALSGEPNGEWEGDEYWTAEFLDGKLEGVKRDEL